MAGATQLIPANIKTTQGELQDTKYWMLNANPSSLVEGLFWFDSVNHKPKYYDGTSVQEYGRIYTQGTGISISAQNAISISSTYDNTLVHTSGAEDIEGAKTFSSWINLNGGANVRNGITFWTNDTPSTIDGISIYHAADTLNTNIRGIDIVNNYHSGTGTTDYPNIFVQNTQVYDGYTQTILDARIPNTILRTSAKGAANGVASLGSDGKVPNSQLPSFVDDVVDAYIVSGATALSSGWLSATDGGSALTPETGKIYVVLSSGTYLNKTYRWSGTTYVEISASPGNATESAAGIAEIATNAEVYAGTDDTRIVTPKKLATYYQGKLTVGSGIAILNDVISVVNYNDFLLNNYSAGGSLGILSTLDSTHTQATAIGSLSEANNNCTAIGCNATASNSSSVHSIAIGNGAHANINSSIQLGYGTNTTAYSLCVGFWKTSTTQYNWQLLDGTTGLIPDARISSSAKKLKYAANNTALTASGGVATWEITHGLGTDDVMLVVKDISTGEIIFPAWKITSGKVTIEFLASANIAADTYRAIIMG